MLVAVPFLSTVSSCKNSFCVSNSKRTNKRNSYLLCSPEKSLKTTEMFWAFLFLSTVSNPKKSFCLSNSKQRNMRNFYFLTFRFSSEKKFKIYKMNFLSDGKELWKTWKIFHLFFELRICVQQEKQFCRPTKLKNKIPKRISSFFSVSK